MSGNEITIKGVVNAVDWDEDGRTISVAILTNDDEEYLVDNNDLGKDLLDFESGEIKASGLVRESYFGEKTITISNFDIIEEGPSEDDEEDDEEEDEKDDEDLPD